MMLLILIIILLLTLLFLRITWVLFIRSNYNILKCDSTRKIKTMIVLGSGGHTTEMLRLVRAIDCTRYSPRIYVVADTDEHSERKVLEFEQISLSGANDFCFHRIPRSREVRQSYLTSVFTTLRATLSAVPLILRERPFLLLCNGPGTCIPICAAFLILKVFSFGPRLLVFVESVCRVKSLSASGLILYYTRLVDELIVFWPELVQQFPRARYLGNIL